MAYPDYSLLVVETIDPQTQAVSRNSYIFSNVSDAQVAFKSEIESENTRVFLFEQPQPTRFKRNDVIPLPTNLDQWD